MRRFLASFSRQPCSWLSCMEVTTKPPSGEKATAVCEPAHFIRTGCCFSIRAYHRAAPPYVEVAIRRPLGSKATPETVRS